MVSNMGVCTCDGLGCRQKVLAFDEQVLGICQTALYLESTTVLDTKHFVKTVHVMVSVRTTIKQKMNKTIGIDVFKN